MKREQPSLKCGGDHREHFSPSYMAVIVAILSVNGGHGHWSHANHNLHIKNHELELTAHC